MSEDLELVLGLLRTAVVNQEDQARVQKAGEPNLYQAPIPGMEEVMLRGLLGLAPGEPLPQSHEPEDAFQDYLSLFSSRD